MKKYSSSTNPLVSGQAGFLLLVVFCNIFFFSCSKTDTPNPDPPPPSALSVNSASFNFPGRLSTDTVTITSNINWRISVPSTAASWLSVLPDNGASGISKSAIRVAANNTTSTRTATITLSAEGSSTVSPIPITVFQDQPDVTISGFTYSAPGGAVISIYGSGFSPVTTENIVKINGATALVNTATQGFLTVTVPMRAGTGPIQITVNTKSVTSSIDFIYLWTGITTIFAGGVAGYEDGVGTNAKFTYPAGLDFDPAGNLIVADYGNSKVRRITPSGAVTTLPGRFPSWNNPTGPNTDFGLPEDVAVDAAGNIYVVEFLSNAISKISSTGIVTLLAGGNPAGYADGIGTAASFYQPSGITLDESGNLIVADAANHRIRKITPAGVVTTIAGSLQAYADGTGSAANFNTPFGICRDMNNSFLVADYYNNRIRRVTSGGLVSTFAGNGMHGSQDGPLLSANIYRPFTAAVSSRGNIYICAEGSNIRLITPDGKVSTIIPSISIGSSHQGIIVDASETIYVSDIYTNKIYKMTIQ